MSTMANFFFFRERNSKRQGKILRLAIQQKLKVISTQTRTRCYRMIRIVGKKIFLLLRFLLLLRMPKQKRRADTKERLQ